MKKLRTKLGILALCAVALCGILRAQLDPMSVLVVLQNGSFTGVIYVPERAPFTTAYVEHWVLFPNYVNPSPANGIVMELVPSRDLSFASELAFFRSVPFGPGYRYIRTLSYDTTMLPGR